MLNFTKNTFYKFNIYRHLPIYLVAAFAKKCARLCLFAPPTALHFILPLIYNLLKKHPKLITSLIHKIEEGEEYKMDILLGKLFFLQKKNFLL